MVAHRHLFCLKIIRVHLSLPHLHGFALPADHHIDDNGRAKQGGHRTDAHLHRRKTVLATKSQNRQNTAPPRKHPGITKMGFAVPISVRTKWGTAMPTKEIGPAKAVTQADRTLDKGSAPRETGGWKPHTLGIALPS